MTPHCKSHELKGAALADQIIANFKSRTAHIGVVGLGYVGLPLCGALVAAGLPTIGLDVDPAKIEALENGRASVRTSFGRFRADDA